MRDLLWFYLVWNLPFFLLADWFVYRVYMYFLVCFSLNFARIRCFDYWGQHLACDESDNNISSEECSDHPGWCHEHVQGVRVHGAEYCHWGIPADGPVQQPRSIRSGRQTAAGELRQKYILYCVSNGELIFWWMLVIITFSAFN